MNSPGLYCPHGQQQGQMQLEVVTIVVTRAAIPSCQRARRQVNDQMYGRGLIQLTGIEAHDHVMYHRLSVSTSQP